MLNRYTGHMDKWTPISLSELWDHVIEGEQKMDIDRSRLWNLIRIDFEKWQLHPWGDLGEGFWVVGIIGKQVLWYNDIEEGFNWSRYDKQGQIIDYFCNQIDLNNAMFHLQDILKGYDGRPQAGPPEKI